LVTDSNKPTKEAIDAGTSWQDVPAISRLLREGLYKNQFISRKLLKGVLRFAIISFYCLLYILKNQPKVRPQSSKLKAVLLFAGIMFLATTYAQENYLPGTVIKTNGDTLNGFINYGNWRINPSKFDFRTDAGARPVTFTVSDVAEFRVQDEIYVGAVVDVETSIIDESRLDYDPNLHIVVDTVFLQTIYNGNKALFYCMNSKGIENLYIKKDGAYELLIYKKYLVRQGTTSYVREKKDYIGQMNIYFSDCPGIRGKIESTVYTMNSLLKLFKEYASCTSSETSFQRKADGVRFEIGPVAGVSLTTLEFDSDHGTFDFLENSNFRVSTSFTGGVFFDLVIPRNQGRLSIDNELLYSSLKTDGYSEYIDGNNAEKKFTTELEYSYLKIINMLRYKIPVGSNYIFLNGGITNGFRLSEYQNVKKEVTTSYSGTTVTEGIPLLNTSKFEQGMVAGAGIRVKKLSFEARMEIGEGIISFPVINSQATRYYFIIGYRFR